MGRRQRDNHKAHRQARAAEELMAARMFAAAFEVRLSSVAQATTGCLAALDGLTLHLKEVGHQMREMIDVRQRDGRIPLGALRGEIAELDRQFSGQP